MRKSLKLLIIYTFLYIFLTGDGFSIRSFVFYVRIEIIFQSLQKSVSGPLNFHILYIRRKWKLTFVNEIICLLPIPVNKRESPFKEYISWIAFVHEGYVYIILFRITQYLRAFLKTSSFLSIFLQNSCFFNSSE